MKAPKERLRPGDKIPELAGHPIPLQDLIFEES
jgi:hypothetical protein